MVDWEHRRAPDKVQDHRTAYERDYARIVHSAAFRRLQAKTQVLGIGDSDFYRTRLTHSLEVSQIGVAIAKKLYREAERTRVVEKMEILPPPMLISSICLAHDLGHPPFGHGGEVALNRCMLPYGGFEGNGQTLRIVSRLEPYHAKYGMNLTKRAVLGVIKYPAPYHDVVDWSIYPGGELSPPTPEQKHHNFEVRLPSSSVFVAKDFKPPKCYLAEEHSDVVKGWVFDGLEEDWEKFCQIFPSNKKGKHPKTKFKSLDTSIMEMADDIAYGVHDLEDGIGLKLITHSMFMDWFNQIESGSKRFEFLMPFLERFHNRDFAKFADCLFQENTQIRKREIGRLVGHFIERAILHEDTKQGFKNPIFRWQACFHPNDVKALEMLKDLVVDLVIRSTPVQQLEFKGQKIVTELFQVFATDPKRLLDERDFKKTIQGGGSTSTPRVICDFIAGMTDEYATKRYQQLFDARIGSVFDRL
jgi:dGTPase